MTVLELAAGYAAVGALLAAVVVARRGATVDALLLLGLWPLYGPLLAVGGAAGDDRERELLAALRRAATTPLGGILPDEPAARALARRLRTATARLREIDAVLARPDFDDRAARARRVELAERGASACAIGSAEMRVQTIDRVRRLWHRFAVELDEVGELIAQLVAQAELVRFAGAADASAAELVRELVDRVEGLDQLMAAEVADDPVDSAARAPDPGGR